MPKSFFSCVFFMIQWKSSHEANAKNRSHDVANFSWKISRIMKNQPDREKSAESAGSWKISWIMKNQQDREKSAGSWKISRIMKNQLDHEKSAESWKISQIMNNEPDREKSHGSWKITRIMENHQDHKKFDVRVMFQECCASKASLEHVHIQWNVYKAMPQTAAPMLVFFFWFSARERWFGGFQCTATDACVVFYDVCEWCAHACSLSK